MDTYYDMSLEKVIACIPSLQDVLRLELSKHFHIMIYPIRGGNCTAG